MDNQHITFQMEQVGRAIKRLEELELTVTSIVLVSKTRPMIFIKPGKACRQLQSSWVRTSAINLSGYREVDRVSMIADCQVRWTENVNPNQARRLS